MKHITDWWGVIMIPETDHEADILKLLLPSKMLAAYEAGSIQWDDSRQINHSLGTTTLPHGALVIVR